MTSIAEGPRGAPVLVTGCGVVSPLGCALDAFDDALFAGRSAVRAHELILPGIDPVPVPVAAVARAVGDGGFDDAAVRAPSRLPLDRGSAMALAAAIAAAADAGLGADACEPTRLGIYWGSGMAGASTFDATCRTVYGEARRMRPTTVVTTMPNAPVAELALHFAARGAALSFASACASSAVAIGEAMLAIRAGRIDVAIVGGSEALLTPGVIASWQAMRVLAPLGATMAEAESRAASACRPFAADRAGFALGEGAAAFVIESVAHARARGRSAMARGTLLGYATNCDGMHITTPDAAGQARAMRSALADAGVAAAEIGYVNAHGTATASGDAAEAASLAAVFGPHGVPVGSTKAIHGHLLGAGGAVELLVLLSALRKKAIPPTANVASADPSFVIDLVTAQPRPAPDLRVALSNSFAFGGTNAVLVASV